MDNNPRQEGTVIASGKTKAVISTEYSGIVNIENNDILSKGDGEELYILPGKGIWATETTCNVFELFKRHGVPLAYIKRVNERTFSAYEADMVKLEIVVRNKADGSYLKRNPEEQEGKVFPEPIIEFYLKSDEEGDPFAVYDPDNKNWLLYDPKKPLQKVLRVMPYLVTKKGILIDSLIIKQIIEIARQINQILKKTWEKQEVDFRDFKFEVGFIIKNGLVTLVVADVVDNDSWRIRFLGRTLDKDVYRKIDGVTPEARGLLIKNYQLVAELSRKFLT